MHAHVLLWSFRFQNQSVKCRYSSPRPRFARYGDRALMALGGFEFDRTRSKTNHVRAFCAAVGDAIRWVQYCTVDEDQDFTRRLMSRWLSRPKLLRFSSRLLYLTGIKVSKAALPNRVAVSCNSTLQQPVTGLVLSRGKQEMPGRLLPERRSHRYIMRPRTDCFCSSRAYAFPQ